MSNEKDNLIIFRTFENLAEASIIQGVLETNGVPCMLSNQEMSAVFPSCGLAGDVSLWINERDLDLAEKILESKPTDEKDEE